MQPLTKLFLTVLLAHLLGDFPLQTSSMIRGKRQGIRAYFAHGAVHLLIVILCLQRLGKRRLLHKIRNKQSRRTKYENHKVSKQIVDRAVKHRRAFCGKGVS
jgi:Protein of unknown function (DUF3307)